MRSEAEGKVPPLPERRAEQQRSSSEEEEETTCEGVVFSIHFLKFLRTEDQEEKVTFKRPPPPFV